MIYCFILLLACSWHVSIFFHVCSCVSCLFHMFYALCHALMLRSFRSHVLMFGSTCSHTWYYVSGYTLLRSTCLYACSILLCLCLCLHCLYAWIHVLPCLYARLVHVDVYVSMPTCLDLCSLHALCHHLYACMLHTMFMCLGLDLVCYATCYCCPFVPFITFSCVLALWLGLDLDPMVFVIVHTPRPTSKGFGSFLFACLCLLASIFYACVSLSSSRLCLVWRPPRA